MTNKYFVSLKEKHSPIFDFKEVLFNEKDKALAWMNSLDKSDIVVTDINPITIEEFSRIKPILIILNGGRKILSECFFEMLKFCQPEIDEI